MFFLCRGFCEVYKTFDQAQPYYICNLYSGAMFGEIAAVLHCRSSATVQCKNYCTVAGFRTEDYFIIAMRYPRLAEKMALHVHSKYRDPITQFFLDRYKRIEYLRKLDKRIISEMSFHLKVIICNFN